MAKCIGRSYVRDSRGRVVAQKPCPLNGTRVTLGGRDYNYCDTHRRIAELAYRFTANFDKPVDNNC